MYAACCRYRKARFYLGDTCVLVYCNLLSVKFIGDNVVRCLRSFIYPSAYCNYIFREICYVPVEQRKFK